MTKPKKDQPVISTASADVRRNRGRARPGVSLPAKPPIKDLPSTYAELLKDIKERVASQRLRIVLSANAAMVQLYWDIGKAILARQAEEGWGAKVIDRLSADLRETFADMQGLSSRNLLFMRSFAEAYPQPEIVKQLVSQLPWGHIVHLLQRVKDPDSRIWYAKSSIANGWSRNILDLQIASKAHQRQGKAVNNFAVPLDCALEQN